MHFTLRYGPAPLPREHGGWAMLLTPPVIALVAAGPSLLGLMAMLGWFAAYCTRAPIEVLRGTSASGRAGLPQSTPEVARLWLLLFGLLTVSLLGPVIYLRPGLLPLLLGAAGILGVVQALADRGYTRSITAGLLASAGLMAGGPLYYMAATGEVSAGGWALAAAGTAFFGGSVFRVKTLARERRSGSFRLISVAVHVGALAGAAVAAAAGLVSPLVAAALLLPAGWAVYGATRAGEPVNLMVIGKGEQWLTIIFGLILMVALRI